LSERLTYNDEFYVPVLKEALSRGGIRVVIWDFDGTLIKTTKLFSFTMIETSGILIYGTNWRHYYWEEAKRFKEEYMMKVVWALRKEMGVNPEIMKLTTYICATQVLHLSKEDPKIEMALDRMSRLYTTDVPEVYRGAHWAVDTFNKAGVPTILATHALPDWTNHKKAVTRFSGKFVRTHNFSIDCPKSEQWQEFFLEKGISPKETISIGDNPWADCLPVIDLGGHAICVNVNPNIYSPDIDGSPDESLGARLEEKGIRLVGDVRGVPKAIVDMFYR
jgi:FMN phosphatase YigB (HAD superfamily)